MLTRCSGYLLNVLCTFNLSYVQGDERQSVLKKQSTKKFYVINSLVNVYNLPRISDLHTSTKETLSGKLHFFVQWKIADQKTTWDWPNFYSVWIGDKHKSQNNEAYDKYVKIKTLKVKLCLFLGRGLFGRRERRLGLKKEVFLGLRYVCVHLIAKRKLRN